MVKMTDKEFKYMVDYVKKHYGIDLSKKRVLLEGRLGNYMAERNFASYTEYMNALEADKSGKELINLLNKVTTNHTYFMRESNHFDFLRDNVFPQMERMVTSRDLRLWCAASSTGEEPYTLAMLLHDYFGKKSPRWDKTMLATDISMKVLTQAQEGVFAAEAIRDVPEHWKRNYFKKKDSDTVQVVQDIRDQVVFRRFNLMDPINAKKPYHVVFCRNVMIYFDAPTKAALIDRIYDAMAPGGYLFIGYTETLPKPTRFKYVMPSVYQKGN